MFNEALATALSDQYQDEPLALDCSLEELLTETGNYMKYYVLGKYMLESYEKDNILKLANNNALLEQMTPTILEEAKAWLTTQYDKKKEIK